MAFSFESLPQLENIRADLPHVGRNPTNSTASKTDIAIHHSLTKSGDAFAFARFHTMPKNKGGQGWPEVAYHFVIKKDGTIQWCHHPSVIGYHVGNSNSFSLGICLVGDFRDEEPTDAQKESLYDLHKCLVNDLPNYKRTRGHDEFPGYAWKPCPEFDYKAVIERKTAVKGTSTTNTLYTNGDSGEEVTFIQERLIALGYDLSTYGADGDYGDETEQAVRAFQRDAGITVDGKAGKETLKHLEEVYNMADTGFKDVNNSDEEYAQAVQFLKEKEVMEGYPDDTFRGENNLTRKEFALALYRALK